MVTNVTIKDNKCSPLPYLSEIPAFANGASFDFFPGVNVIVGENGCGKSTLLKLIQTYLMVDRMECDKGDYGINITKLYRKFDAVEKDVISDGVDVFADYTKNVFKLCHQNENENKELKDFESFGTLYTQKHSSTGESVIIAMNSLFKYMFSKNAKLTFDYSQFEESYKSYYDYVNAHRVECPNEYTIIMDEPDRNLSINNIDQIKDILSFHKEQTQVIAVIHNPLIIYSLAFNDEVNFIELSSGYMDKVIEVVEKIVIEK